VRERVRVRERERERGVQQQERRQQLLKSNHVELKLTIGKVQSLLKDKF
jgi:hypothetical protein